jgi:hypothetical protein
MLILIQAKDNPFGLESCYNTPACEASLLPRAHLSRWRPRPACQLSFPQSPPLLRLIPTAGAIPAKSRCEHPAKAASCHPVPSSHCWSTIAGRTITSPPVRRRLSAALLYHRYTVEMPVPGARQWGPAQPTLLTELALPKGCRLDPDVALLACACGRLGAVRWCASSCRLDTAPPTLSSVARTTTYGQNSFGVVSTQIPYRCLPRCTPLPARVCSRCPSTTER